MAGLERAGHAALPGQRLEGAHQPAHEAHHFGRRGVQRLLAGFEPAQVEQLVDEVQQAPGVALHQLGQLAGGGLVGGGGNLGGGAQQQRERGPKLVGDVGEKARLHPVQLAQPPGLDPDFVALRGQQVVLLADFLGAVAHGGLQPLVLGAHQLAAVGFLGQGQGRKPLHLPQLRFERPPGGGHVARQVARGAHGQHQQAQLHGQLLGLLVSGVPEQKHVGRHEEVHQQGAQHSQRQQPHAGLPLPHGPPQHPQRVEPGHQVQARGPWRQVEVGPRPGAGHQRQRHRPQSRQPAPGLGLPARRVREGQQQHDGQRRAPLVAQVGGPARGPVHTGRAQVQHQARAGRRRQVQAVVQVGPLRPVVQEQEQVQQGQHPHPGDVDNVEGVDLQQLHLVGHQAVGRAHPGREPRRLPRPGVKLGVAHRQQVRPPVGQRKGQGAVARLVAVGAGRVGAQGAVAAQPPPVEPHFRRAFVLQGQGQPLPPQRGGQGEAQPEAARAAPARRPLPPGKSGCGPQPAAVVGCGSGPARWGAGPVAPVPRPGQGLRGLGIHLGGREQQRCGVRGGRAGRQRHGRRRRPAQAGAQQPTQQAQQAECFHGAVEEWQWKQGTCRPTKYTVMSVLCPIPTAFAGRPLG